MNVNPSLLSNKPKHCIHVTEKKNKKTCMFVRERERNKGKEFRSGGGHML